MSERFSRIAVASSASFASGPKQQFANHSSFRLCPANESKIVLPHVRDDYGQKGIYGDEEGSRLGECAPIPRDSFVVPSNCGLPSPSKLVAPGASRGMGTSRSSRARSLLRGLRQPDTRPTTGNIGKNCGTGQACLRLAGHQDPGLLPGEGRLQSRSKARLASPQSQRSARS